MLDTQPETTIVDRAADRIPDAEPRGVWIAVLFASTSFVGAAMLFMVQPLAAKLILPSFGGSATVWSTSSLFFQVLLLLGYVYAHVSCRRLGAWGQPRFHVLVLLVPLLFLPIALPLGAAPDADRSPTLWLLWILTLMIGVPFLVLSATGPLIQRWYSWSRGPRANDPYFLFAGSNLGSFVGLLSYPFVIEPHLSITEQRWTWSIVFAVFLALMMTCAVVVRAPRTDRQVAPSAAPPTSRGQIVLWGALAFLPSCFMLAVTAHISTDVAPIPMIWVLPLALYLASFVAAFARRSRRAPAVLTRAAVASTLLCGVVSITGSGLPIALVVALDLTAVALVSYAAHARLAATRPDAEGLTGFYLIVSVGGALGGFVNGMLAPMLFNRVWEYGLTLAAVPLLMIGLLPERSTFLTRRYHPVFRGVTVAALTTAAMLTASTALSYLAPRSTVVMLCLLALIAAAGYALSRSSVALAACLLLGTVGLGAQVAMDSMSLDRTFYGSYRILDADGKHVLVHGTTVHGSQFREEERQTVPTGYYARSGPLGRVMDAIPHRRAAVIGLGAGTIAAYGDPGDRFTFFEIDPLVGDIATDPAYFTFLADSAATTAVKVGDGRLMMSKEPPGKFDLVILDAFSSDAIPVHLLTKEAMEVYAERLAPGGSIVVHISNRIFDLEPVLRATADELGWAAVRGDGRGSPAEDSIRSRWVVLTPDPRLADDLDSEPGWTPVPTAKSVSWTDDYASVLSVLR